MALTGFLQALLGRTRTNRSTTLRLSPTCILDRRMRTTIKLLLLLPDYAFFFESWKHYSNKIHPASLLLLLSEN